MYEIWKDTQLQGISNKMDWYKQGESEIVKYFIYQITHSIVLVLIDCQLTNIV